MGASGRIYVSVRTGKVGPLTRSSMMRLASAAFVAIAFAGLSPVTAHGADGAWVPQSADDLRRVADAIDDARRRGDDAALRSGLVRLAESMIDGEAGGGFTLAPERWVGAGDYLAETLHLIPEPARGRALEAIDLIVSTRFPEARPDAGPAREQVALRVARDFPDSRFAAEARDRLASLYLARGQLGSYLELAPRESSTVEGAVARWLARPPADSHHPELAENPLILKAKIDWKHLPERAYAGAPIAMIPVSSQGRAWLQGLDEMRCIELERGIFLWRTSFLGIESSPNPLPGARLEPALFGPVVVAANLRAVTVFDRDQGKILWERQLVELFPGAPEGTPFGILSVTPPLATEHGILVAVFAHSGANTNGRIVLFDAGGRQIWNHAAGSAPGATYAGLGAARPALAAVGPSGYLLTERGVLCGFHLADGAWEWAVNYPAHSPPGSQDALRNADHFSEPGLVVRGDWLIGAPVDAGSLCFWERRSGVLRAALPRGDVRWWSLADGERNTRIALVEPRAVSFWDWDGVTLRAEKTIGLPDGSAPFSGPFAGGPDLWWGPAGTGIAVIDARDSTCRVRPAPDRERITSLTMAGARLIAGDERRTLLLAPDPVPERGAESILDRIRLARHHLVRGEGAAIRALLIGLRGESISRRGQERDALEQLALEVIAGARGSPLGLAAADWADLAIDAMSLLLLEDDRGQHGWDWTRELALAGDVETATHFAYAVLALAPEARVTVTDDVELPAELALRRLLLELEEDAGALPGQGEREAEAARLLEKAKVGDQSDDYRRLARTLPYTAAGRRGALELARKHFQQENRRHSLEELWRLVLLEPETPEAVEARFRMAELHRDEERHASARRLLDELIERYGGLRVSGSAGEDTVAARAESMKKTLREMSLSDETALDAGLQLMPAWRSRVDLFEQRQLEVTPIGTHPALERQDLFLTLAERKVALHGAQDGQRLWVAYLPRVHDRTNDPFPDVHGRLRGPLAITADTVIFHDLETVFGIDLLLGIPRWQIVAGAGSGDAAEDQVSPGDRAAPGAGILHAVAGEGVALVALLDDSLTAIDLAQGKVRWAMPLGYTPAAAPRIRAGRFLIAALDPPRVEIRNLAQGTPIRTFALEPGTHILPDHEPWFLDDRRVAIPYVIGEGESAGIRVLEINGGEPIWSYELPSPLHRIHVFDELPFFIAEMRVERAHPSLLGIASADGRVLFTRSQQQGSQSITELRYHAGSLYLLEGEFSSRSLTCLRVPPVLLRSEFPEDLPSFELEREWSAPLASSDFPGKVAFHQDWVLVQNASQSELTVLSRTGEVERSLFLRVKDFIERRQKLFHVGFIGDTLVAFTRRGAMGFRPHSHREHLERNWRTAAQLDLTASEEPSSPPGAALTSYRAGRLEEACRILERRQEQPFLSQGERLATSWALEGMAQERGEESHPAWQAQRMPRPPTIDGSLDEPWNAAAAVDVRAGRYFHPIQGPHEDPTAWGGWHDLSVTVYMGWSDEGFHVALDVIDDGIYPYDGDVERWNGDCLLLAFDLDDDGGFRPDQNDLLMTLALSVPKQPNPNAPEGADGDDAKESEPDGDFQVERKADGSGMIYEVTIPWETFHRALEGERGTIPYPGLRFGMNLVLTDDDTGHGSTTYMSLSAGQILREETNQVWEHFIPQYFPDIKLAR